MKLFKVRKIFSVSKFSGFEDRKKYLIVAREFKFLLSLLMHKGDINRSDFFYLFPYLRVLRDSKGYEFIENFNNFLESSLKSKVELLDELMVYFFEKAERNLEYENMIFEGDLGEENVSRIDLYVFLDRIRSPKNVGAIFRVVENFGGKGVFLYGYTPDSSSKGVKKTSMGAEKYIDEVRVDDVKDLFGKFKKNGGKIYALEKILGAKPVFELTPHLPSIIIVGNEELGVGGKILNLCDEVIFIPTFGVKNSYNVSHSLAIFLYEFRKKLIKNKIWEKENV